MMRMNVATLASNFAHWLDGGLKQRIPAEVRAFNFNLYEGVSCTWDIELTGATAFDSADPDWACDPVFFYSEMFFMSREVIGDEWEQGLVAAIELLTMYLQVGKSRDVLRDSLAVGVGFVDGDITILWPESVA